MTGPIDLAAALERIDGYYSPRIVGSYNDSKLMLVKIKGEFVWHSHPDTDDLFLVLQGRIEIFDILNHANFGQPGSTAQVNSTSFGIITNTRFPTGDSGSSRQMQFAVKLIF